MPRYLCRIIRKGRTALPMKRKLPRLYADQKARRYPSTDARITFGRSPEHQERLRQHEERVHSEMTRLGIPTWVGIRSDDHSCGNQWVEYLKKLNQRENAQTG